MIIISERRTMNNFWNTLPKPFFILAPMEAVTDVVFRHVVAAAGRPDIFFTEFTNAASYASENGQHSTRGRLTFTDDEHPMVAQIWGNNPEHFEFMAKGLAAQGFKGIDINMGCPVTNVATKACGSGLIREPELAAALIAAAKKGGLPVSVKTRLGYTRTDEFIEWLSHILRQDIVNLTIHLRTRKEMSKVPAHYELIPAIKALRDEIAPHTLLTVNGDIEDRAHGLALVEKYGVDGIMIGRGIFHNPFAFKAAAEETQERVAQGRVPARVFGSAKERDGRATVTGPVSYRTGQGDLQKNDGEASASFQDEKQALLKLLNLHLDLFDKYSSELEPRKFEPLKRFFKIYIRNFDGASELREKLMHTKNTDEVRQLINT